MTELEAGLEAVLFAAGDAVPAERLAAALETSPEEVFHAAEALQSLYDFEKRGIMLLRLEDKLQLASRPLYAAAVRRATESRRPPSLSPAALEVFQGEWLDAGTRDFNHPAIVGWCPLNETWDRDRRKQIDATLAMIYRVTKLLDPTRPCIDTSGNYHVITDIYDVHDYEQDPEEFGAHYEAFRTGGDFYDLQREKGRQQYVKGLPMFVSEYGGIKWNPQGDVERAWGYGQGPRTEEEFIARYRDLTDALLDNPNMFGFCYTQLYDVEQETNGLYTYNREPKFDMKLFAAINGRTAACEKELSSL